MLDGENRMSRYSGNLVLLGGLLWLACATRVFPKPLGGGIVIVSYPYNFIAGD
jgi:hypothetical protein